MTDPEKTAKDIYSAEVVRPPDRPRHHRRRRPWQTLTEQTGPGLSQPLMPLRPPHVLLILTLLPVQLMQFLS